MKREQFHGLVAPITRFIGTRALDATLERDLNVKFSPGSVSFAAIRGACEEAIADGWMCAQGEGKRKFGRVFEPSADLAGFSVDVVDITDLVGGHHRHPTGEIDMIMPVTPDAQFDGRGAGWLVYEPGSAHRPTVSKGRARILYLLPEGRIEWSKP